MFAQRNIRTSGFRGFLAVTALSCVVVGGITSNEAWGQCAEEVQKVLASDGSAGDIFGMVRLQGDRFVVGAPYAGTGGAVYVFGEQGGVWTEEEKLIASDAASGDQFGLTLSIDGELIVVGANWNDDAGSTSGSAYVFREAGGIWTEEAKLVASDAASGDWFGNSVSVDGDVILVGSPFDGSSGSAYIFRYNGAVWNEEQKLTGSNAVAGALFGARVWLDGEVAVVGAYSGSSPGFAYVFRFNGAEWVEEQKLAASDGAFGDQFGVTVFVSGDVAAISAPSDDDLGADSGSAYIFRYNGAAWNEEAKLTASDGAAGDRFGDWARISGDAAIVGSTRHDGVGSDSGAAYLYRYDDASASWSEIEKITASDASPGDEFSHCAIDQDLVVVGARRDDDNGSESGSVYVFDISDCLSTGCDPQEVQKLLASDGTAGDKFGSQVWVDGDWAIIGAQVDDEAGNEAGSAYIFRRVGATWMEQAKLIASDAAAVDRFGRWVAMDGDRAVIGASLHDDGGSNTGAAYVFTREGDDWIEQAKLTASDAMPGDQLGGGVAIQGDWIVAGASQNSVNGGSGPGKVYLFHLDDNDTWVEVAQLAASDGAFNDIFGFDLAIQDDVIVVAAPQANPAGSDSGAVYVFRLVEDEWIEEQKLVPTTPIAGDQFGRHVSISGDRIAGGALGGTGRAFVFRYEDDEWIEEAQLTGSDVAAGDSFGNTLSLDGNQLLVSAFTHDEAGSGSGSAYLFLLDDNGTPDDPDDDSWMEAAELIASDGAAGDNFGTDVSVSGTTAFITAQEDDDAGSSSGSAYVFELCGPDSEEAALLSFSVMRGDLLAGDLQSLEDSDDDYVQIDAQFNNPQSVYVSSTLIRAKSPTTTVSRLDLIVETGGDADFVLTRILLRNFDTGDWDLLEGFSQSESDSQALILDVPNPNAYVRDDHGQIGVRIETRANADQVPGGYIFRIDHVQLAITAGEGGGVAGGDNALPCDLDGDGVVATSDLVILLGMWGACGDCNTCQPDFNIDCVVDANDLLILLGNWG